eukprot:9030203-Pyramimonas_sp.AAC.1
MPASFTCGSAIPSAASVVGGFRAARFPCPFSCVIPRPCYHLAMCCGPGLVSQFWSRNGRNRQNFPTTGRFQNS